MQYVWSFGKKPRSHFALIATLGFLSLNCVVNAQVAAENSASEAALHVYRNYSSHMVLQREKPIVIAGTAPVGSVIQVTLEQDQATGVAASDGEWSVQLPARPAGGPFTVTVALDDQQVHFEDVLIGEVWFCSGQSNMTMPVFSGAVDWSARNGEAEAETASNYPQLRLFQTPETTSPFEIQRDLPARVSGWQRCTSETVKPFSATAFFFARELSDYLNIPVGVIQSSWSGTRIEGWISEDAYRTAQRPNELAAIASAKMTREDAQKIRNDFAQKQQKLLDEWFSKFNQADPVATTNALAWRQVDFDDAAWLNVELPGNLAEQFDGVFWVRRDITLSPAWMEHDLTLHFDAIDDCDEVFFNGQAVGNTEPDVPRYYTVNRNYTIPREILREGRNVLAVRVRDYLGNGGVFGKMTLADLQSTDRAQDLSGTWRFAQEYTVNTDQIGNRPAPIEEATGELDSPQYPATLYQGMVAPWTRYPLRGFLWYQGESNAGNAQDYMKLMPLLIEDWRAQWQDEKMPFLLTQLAPFADHILPISARPKEYQRPANYEPGNNGWSQLREVQTAVSKQVPLTGQAVIIDDNTSPYDIHPNHKQLVGHRLALEARRLAYGDREVTTGPYYQSIEFADGKAIVSFENGAGLKLLRGTTPGALEIAGEDGKFVWAEGQIEGDRLIVWSSKVAAPTAVRYAWSQFVEDANIGNAANLPLSPFRSDVPAYLLRH